MYPLLAAMLTSRPWDDIVNTDLDSLSPKERSAAHDTKISGYVQQYANHIAEILRTVPPQMLLLFKLNDCLRHSDRMLGTPINTHMIVARMCVSVLAVERQREQPGVRSWVVGVWEQLQLEVRIVLFQLARWYWAN